MFTMFRLDLYTMFLPILPNVPGAGAANAFTLNHELMVRIANNNGYSLSTNNVWYPNARPVTRITYTTIARFGMLAQTPRPSRLESGYVPAQAFAPGPGRRRYSALVLWRPEACCDSEPCRKSRGAKSFRHRRQVSHSCAVPGDSKYTL